VAVLSALQFFESWLKYLLEILLDKVLCFPPANLTMKKPIIIVSVVMGFFLALPIHTFVSSFLSDYKSATPLVIGSLVIERPFEIAILLLILILWILCSVFLLDKFSDLKKLIRIGFLLWASEWLVSAMLLLAFGVITGLISAVGGDRLPPEITNAKEASTVVAQSAKIIGEVLAVFSGIVSGFMMALFGLIGYAISILLPRELE
jgi:hypothetical protein